MLDATDVAHKDAFLFCGRAWLRIKIELELYLELIILTLQLGYHTVFLLYLLLNKGSVEMDITCLSFNLEYLIFCFQIYDLTLVILLYPLKYDPLCCLNHLFLSYLLYLLT